MEEIDHREEKEICPYNNSHHIRRCKFSFHLVRCRRSYGPQKMVPCDFNSTHLVPEPEIYHHHKECPDRKKVESRIVPQTTNKFPIRNVAVVDEENWDTMNCPSYDPTTYAENHEVIRGRDVLSEAKRKTFRISERQRLGELSKQTNRPERDHGVEMNVVKLPAHRRIADVVEETFDSSMARGKLETETGKVFLQYEPGTSKDDF
jgi:hypothetical protein